MKSGYTAFIGLGANEIAILQKSLHHILERYLIYLFMCRTP